MNGVEVKILPRSSKEWVRKIFKTFFSDKWDMMFLEIKNPGNVNII
jgi:hypothetical protein